MASDYSMFSPAQYLEAFYGETDEGAEGSFLMKFFHDAYLALPDNLNILEVGGGPTIYQLISASSKAKEIIFSEYADENIAEVKKWLSADETAFNWDDYFKMVLKYEGKVTSFDNLNSIKFRLHSRLKN